MSNIIPKFFGEVTAKGLEFYDRNLLSKYLKGLVGKKVSIIIKRYHKSRTDQQNKYYFGVVIKMISDHTGQSKESVHNNLKILFLGYQTEFLDAKGEKVYGRLFRSTTQLTTKEFGGYIEQVKDWAAEFLELIIPEASKIDMPNYY